MFKIKRVYEAAESTDGYRVLVDRLWPRGVSKAKAHVDLWMKEVGPSDKLRKWFGHDPERWTEFQKRYKVELRKNSTLTTELKQLEKQHRTVTLVYSAHDEQHNQAVALSAFLQRSGANKVR
jgi:uncharacterized protein YeaO (DUF488 family)